MYTTVTLTNQTNAEMIHDTERYYCHLVCYSETSVSRQCHSYGTQITDEKQDITAFLLWAEYYKLVTRDTFEAILKKKIYIYLFFTFIGDTHAPAVHIYHHNDK